MLFEKYTSMNELFDYEPISDKEWIPMRRREFNWATLYGVDLTGCNIRNRRKNNVSNSHGNCVQEELSDINRWNCGYWAAVLISPNKAVACAHYWRVVKGQQNSLRFWGRSGIEYRPKFKSATELGFDRVIIEFEDDLPVGDVKIYKIVDFRWIPKGTKLWFHDNQGRILFKIHDTLKQMNVPGGFNYQQVWNPDPVMGDICAIHSGDSGTPVLMTDPFTNETYFVGNFAGGYPYYDDRQMEMRLKDIDHRIQMVKPSESRADTNRDGKIDGADLAAVFENFGHYGFVQGDINGDGVIDAEDLGAILADWGEAKPNYITYDDWYFDGITGGQTGDKGNSGGQVTVIRK